MYKIEIKACVVVFVLVGFLLLGLGVVLVRAELPNEKKIQVKRETHGNGSPLFSMEFREADLKDILRALGQQNRLNIIMSDDVKGKVTLSFQKVGLFDALESILKIHNLTYFREKNIIRVVRSPFSEGEGDLMTETIGVKYGNASESSKSLKTLLSKNGSVSFDERTNTLIVRDVPENVRRIVDLVKELDTITPQVLIEAKIVEAVTSFSQELGVQWGGNFSTSGGSGTSTIHGGSIKGSPLDPIAGSLTGDFGATGAPFAVNLPAAVGSGAGGALGFSFANFSNTRLLDIQLSALEDSGKGRIISNPKILTLNNKEARISEGTEILIPTATIVTTAGTTGGGSQTGGETSASGVKRIPTLVKRWKASRP